MFIINIPRNLYAGFVGAPGLVVSSLESRGDASADAGSLRALGWATHAAASRVGRLKLGLLLGADLAKFLEDVNTLLVENIVLNTETEELLSMLREVVVKRQIQPVGGVDTVLGYAGGGRSHGNTLQRRAEHDRRAQLGRVSGLQRGEVEVEGGVKGHSIALARGDISQDTSRSDGTFNAGTLLARAAASAEVFKNSVLVKDVVGRAPWSEVFGRSELVEIEGRGEGNQRSPALSRRFTEESLDVVAVVAQAGVRRTRLRRLGRTLEDNSRSQRSNCSS